MTQEKARAEVKALMKHKGWTQKQAAMHFNVAFGTFQHFLRGRDASEPNFNKIIAKLGKQTANGVEAVNSQDMNPQYMAEDIKQLKEQVAALTEEVSRLRQWKDTSFGTEDHWTPWDDSLLMQQ